MFQPNLGEDEIDALRNTFRSGWIGLGPVTVEFEKQFAIYLHRAYAIGLNSCTSALDLALRLLRLKKGDEVIVPTITFVSTAHAVAYSNATPVFADIEPESMQIDPEEIRKKITKKTKAIMVVHYGGRPVDMDRIHQVCGDIPVIEDAAHACGASYQGKRVGSIGRMGCFSFHAVKNLPMGDGGALVLDDPELAQRAHRLRWLGIDKGTWDRAKDETKYLWDYDVDEIGYKYHMNDIHAAIGIVQLKKLDENNRRRKAIAQLYYDRLKSVSWLELPLPDDEVFQSAWHLFQVKVARGRDVLLHFLRDQGISTGVHYKPIHLYRCYGSRVSLPRAEKEFEKLLSLPFHLALSENDVDYVCETIKKFKP